MIFTVQDMGDQINRLHLAVYALDAVRDLCVQASEPDAGKTLSHVGSDNFALLLGLVITEMNAALDALDEIPVRGRAEAAGFGHTRPDTHGNGQFAQER